MSFKESGKLSKQEVQKLQAEKWQAMFQSERLDWVAATLDLPASVPSQVSSEVHAEVPVRDDVTATRSRTCAEERRALGALATWNGEWLQSNPQVLKLIRSGLPVEQVAHEMAMVPELQMLFSDFKCFLEEQCNRMELPQLSLCIEMSTHAKQEGRIHLHAVFSRLEVKAHIGWPKDWVFRSSKPLLRLNTTPGRHAHKSMARAHYYAQAPKIGWVCGSSTYQKHVQLGVEPTWILGLWRLRKLSHESAKQEIREARVNAQRYFKEIEFIENQEGELADQLESKKVNEMLAKSFRPFVMHDD